MHSCSAPTSIFGPNSTQNRALRAPTLLLLYKVIVWKSFGKKPRTNKAAFPRTDRVDRVTFVLIALPLRILQFILGNG
jgi:hypothetical protein